MKMPTKT
jgi:hypothetical protein